MGHTKWVPLTNGVDKPRAPSHPPAAFRVLRDWYADTPYDLTKGLAAGPFGSPNRYAGGAGEQQVKVRDYAM